jgi:hypothetical protein
VRDPIQPGTQAQVAAVGAQAAVGTDEYVLEDVLRIGMWPREHLTYVRQQPRAIAVVDDPEGIVVSAAEEPDELLVRPQSQQRRAKRDSPPP